MRKRFVAVVEFEESDEEPMDLSSLATWVEARLGGCVSVEVTTFHTAQEAALDEAEKRADELRIADVRLVNYDSGHKQVCAKLRDGTERLLHMYVDKGASFDSSAMVGRTLAEANCSG